MLETVKARIAELGPRFDPAVLKETRALYQPLVPPPPAGTTVLRDVAYGSDPRQRLDVYAPAGAAGVPVLIYVPGGGFVGGDKYEQDGFYANLGHWFAVRGFLVLAINYRLAPAHLWPAGGEDVGHAVGWARAQAAGHGGDPERIAVFGQSAGASHTLAWLFDPVLDGVKPVGAVVLASGSYRVGGDRIPPNVLAYYGTDPSRYQARSPITHVRKTNVPFLLTVSEFDPPFLASPTFELAARLTNENGRTPEVRWLEGHNHVSNVLSVGTPDDGPANVVAAFLDAALS